MNGHDIERLRRELAEYVEVEDEPSQNSDREASRDKRTVQDLMNEVIRITSTEASPGICDPEITTGSNAEERERHSVERAVSNTQEQRHIGPAPVRATPQTSREDSVADEAGRQPDARDILFSPARWVFLCAFILALFGTVAGAVFVLVQGITDTSEPVAAASTTAQSPVPATPVMEAANSDLAPEQTAASTSAAVEPSHELQPPSQAVAPGGTGAVKLDDRGRDLSAPAAASVAAAPTSRQKLTKQAKKRPRGSVATRKAPVRP